MQGEFCTSAWSTSQCLLKAWSWGLSKRKPRFAPCPDLENMSTVDWLSAGATQRLALRRPRRERGSMGPVATRSSMSSRHDVSDTGG